MQKVHRTSEAVKEDYARSVSILQRVRCYGVSYKKYAVVYAILAVLFTIAMLEVIL